MKHLKLFEEEEEKPSRLERAKAADLVTFPKGIEGAVCTNCQYVDLKKKYCTHKDVDQKIDVDMCCSLWNSPGTMREWEENKKDNNETY